MLAQVDAGQARPDERRRDGDEQAPGAQRADDEVRHGEQPPGEDQAERVDDLRDLHEPAREHDATDQRDRDRQDDRLRSDTQVRVGEPEQAGRPVHADLAAADDLVEVAAGRRLRVSRERERLDRQHERGDEAEEPRDHHLDRRAPAPGGLGRTEQVGVVVEDDVVVEVVLDLDDGVVLAHVPSLRHPLRLPDRTSPRTHARRASSLLTQHPVTQIRRSSSTRHTPDEHPSCRRPRRAGAVAGAVGRYAHGRDSPAPRLRLPRSPGHPARSGDRAARRASSVDEDATLAAARERFAGPDEDLDAADSVLVLAQAKAHDVAAHLPDALADADDLVVLGCDSMLELDGEVLGKPRDAADATARWQAMRGRVGTLHTGHWLVDLREPDADAPAPRPGTLGAGRGAVLGDDLVDPRALRGPARRRDRRLRRDAGAARRGRGVHDRRPRRSVRRAHRG